MFENLKDRYEKKHCRKDQLKRFVALEAITEEEYGLITGETLDGELIEFTS